MSDLPFAFQDCTRDDRRSKMRLTRRMVPSSVGYQCLGRSERKRFSRFNGLSETESICRNRVAIVIVVLNAQRAMAIDAQGLVSTTRSARKIW